MTTTTDETRTETVNYAPDVADPFLKMKADILDDLERTKIANQNRLRSLTRKEEDADGIVRGLALPEDHPDVVLLTTITGSIESLEADAVKNLQKAMKKNPLGPWAARQKGVGDKQIARLLASIGDPYWRDEVTEKHEDGTETVRYPEGPRTVSALWAYCGLHVVSGSAPKRKAGVKSNWSTLAKTRSWLIIDSCSKQLDKRCKTDTGIADHVEGCGCSKYRIIIDNRRKHTAVTHPEWSKGQSKNDGMRIAQKELLKDMWIESKRIHEERRAAVEELLDSTSAVQ